MKKSESIATLASALTKAQAEIKNAPKSGTNPHFKNKYVPLDEMIPVCKEALNANGISFIQGAEQSESGDVLHLSTMLLHTSGEWLESTLTMKPVKADPQGIGSCITYARRYSLAAICGVASEEDDDGNAASQPEPAKKAPAKPAKSEPTPQGGHEHDGRTAQYGRIQVQKARPAVKDWPEVKWEALLCNAFSIESKAQIAELSPMGLAAGIDKLIILIDELEQEVSA